MSTPDPTLLAQLCTFLTREFGEEADDTLAEMVFSAVESCKTASEARTALQDAFELDSVDDVPLGEVQCKTLLQLINDYNTKGLSKLLLNGHSNATPEGPQSSPDPIARPVDYSVYQRFTHDATTELRKQEILKKEGSAVQALADPLALAPDRPKQVITNARELVFPGLSNTQLLEREVDPLQLYELDQVLTLTKAHDDVKVEPERGRPRRRSPSPPRHGADRERNRIYNDNNSNQLNNPYLQLAPQRGEESYPIQYKIYRGEVDHSLGGDKKTFFSVKLHDFPQVPAILPRALIIPNKEHPDDRDIKQFVQDGTELWVKVLSNYAQLLKEKQLNHNTVTASHHSQVKVTVAISDVDQASGNDMNPHLAYIAPAGRGSEKAVARKNFSGLSEKSIGNVSKIGNRIRDSSQERWREAQSGNGLANVNMPKRKTKTPGIDSDNDFDLSDDDDNLDVDLADVEPAFLQGFGSNIHALTQHSIDSTKLVQIEDGELFAAARKQSQMAQERRQMNQDRLKQAVSHVAQEADQKLAMQDNLKQWADPLMAGAAENSEYGDPNATRPRLQQQMLGDLSKKVLETSSDPNIGMNARKLVPVKTYGRLTNETIDQQRKSLPVYKLRGQFLDMVRDNQICIVVGATGSGKTTQMAQYLYEAGYGQFGIIGCTQPRRVAATSVAARVAEEVGCELGTTVGYSVRFDEKTTPKVTKIKYMTDGMLLREILLDPAISRYSVMIIDEAHERSVNTDVLLALIKAACKQRPDLKFIVTSATLDAGKFSQYMGGCPIFDIPGRSYPVDIYYAPTAEPDYFEAAMRTVLELHLNQPPGDILLFLTGQEEIEDAVVFLEDQIKRLEATRSVPGLDVYPMYSSLPNEIQSEIFTPTRPGRRKCVVSTNIAEASVTIDGIVYVIDTGVSKVSVYDPKQNMESLQITPISQAQAKQRAGRAGRTQHGECYRLYTELAFSNEMMPTSVPELQRCDLTSVILLLKALGINDLLGFDFIDPPSTSSMLLALRQLYWLGAVDNDGLLTPVGARLAMLPVSPSLGKMLLVAADLGCVQEIATIVALVSGDELWTRPKSSVDAADRARNRFNIPQGDHATLVNVFNQWEAEGRSSSWAVKNFLSVRALEGAYKVKLQLIRTLANMKVELSSCGKNWTMISRAVAAGLFMNAAKREVTEDKSSKSILTQQPKTQITYTTLTYSNSAPIHPSSSLASHMPQFIVYQKLLLTTKEWLHTCTIIHPGWLIELAPHLYAERSDLTSTGANHRKNQIRELHNPHHAPGSWRLSHRK